MPGLVVVLVPLEQMSMSDDYMILTIERMQIELRRAMEDIQVLRQELQRRSASPASDMTMAMVAPVPVPAAMAAPEPMPVEAKVKKVIKVKKVPVQDVPKKPTAIAPWNAYVSIVRAEMQAEMETKPTQDQVVAQAKARKDASPGEYKTFTANWHATH